MHRPRPRRGALSEGPSGGYTPAQLAKAYGVDVNAAASANQTVAIVDAFDDPTVKTDLATFDTNYGLPAETSTSFRVVNQTGGSTLPAANAGWAGEITLDVQAVRGLCHKCKILLVEANSNSFDDLAAAVNEAATLHANEISNSYGGAETGAGITPTIAAAYNHPGIAIVASTGDDGWYDWDRLNNLVAGANAPQAPAALPSVVGVSGTSLYLNPDGTRAGETVWNNNGPNDAIGWALEARDGRRGRRMQHDLRRRSRSSRPFRATARSGAAPSAPSPTSRPSPTHSPVTTSSRPTARADGRRSAGRRSRRRSSPRCGPSPAGRAA